MSFDKATRNLLAKTVTACRRRLIEDVTDQLRSVFGLHPDGTVLGLEEMTHLSPDQTAAAGSLRDLLDHYTAGAAGKEKDRRTSAYERMTLEISFTILNRLAALRLCEERGLVVECVRKGTTSAGFQMFERISGGALGGRYEAYRVFLECLFDELALDLGVLFDRTTPQSAIFPSEQCLFAEKGSLKGVLVELNNPELTHLWTEDETIGWVYQYFNPPEERKAMRDASQAPQNSRELAVRNQFFTPRYVVEFLTDNTLGRIWYEMRKADTALKEECRYLVRQPTEVFLAAGEKAPSNSGAGTDLSQEELLKQPVYIEHRPKKDPRNLRVLDPACGSGHFLLYAFDLLEQIYEEAWGDLESPQSENTGRTLQEDFETLDDLRREAPKLIMEHNLHGIDIDSRAVQIAALALWLRAQKTWKNLGIKTADRPQVAKSNIVTAEPMPREEEMRDDFTASLKPRVLGQFVDTVFDKMKLAGETGSLLKIEDEIKDVVSEAKEQWLKSPKAEQQFLFPEQIDPKLKQQELRFDLNGFTDEGFWEQAEDRILDALKEYSEKAENGRTVIRRLFAEDAARGFAFVDLCRKRYDAVVMNPPFGAAARETQVYLGRNYPKWSKNILCAFVDRTKTLTLREGYIGAIFDRTAAIKSSYEGFRSKSILPYISAVADTGWYVLDANVETTVHVWMNSKNKNPAAFFDVLAIDSENKPEMLEQGIVALLNGSLHKFCYLKLPELLLRLPNAVVGYYFPDFLISAFNDLKNLAESGFQARKGHDFVADEHVRLFWEVLPQDLATGNRFRSLYNGGGFSLFLSPLRDVAIFGDNGALISNHPSVYIRNAKFHLKPGIGYGKRGDILDAHLLPAGFSFTSEGLAITDICLDSALLGLGYLNSAFAQFAVNHYCGQHKQVGYVNLLPFPKLMQETKQEVISNSLAIILLKQSWVQYDETTRFFRVPLFKITRNSLRECANIIQNKMLADTAELNKRISWNDEVFIERSISCSEINKQRIHKFQSQRPSDHIWPDLDCDSNTDDFLTFFVDFMLSYCLGLAFGRWDVRIALENSFAPKLPEPFDSLPACPPGMLVGPDGLPAESGRIASEEWLRARPNAATLPPEESINAPTISDAEYPLRISWNGILVDDPGGIDGWLPKGTSQPHQDDIVRRMHEVLDLLWKDKAHEIEQEACDILGVSDLRDYFRMPAKFFQDHFKRYTKSRRKAPIYWPLSTASGSYTIWLYYHRLTDQTLFAAVNKYVEPKISEVERGLSRIEDTLKAASGGEATRLRDRLNEAQTFLGELRDLREELLRIAALPYNPNLNDGVIINASPLHGLFRLSSWVNDTKKVWDKLQKREYDWAHMAYTIWPDKVRDACKKDRSIALAHELEDLCEVEAPKIKKRKNS